MMLAMRREIENHYHATLAATTGTVATSSLTVTVSNASANNNNNLILPTSNASNSDTLNTPSTPMLNLGRSPLHFTGPPPPPPPISIQPGPQFGFYSTAPSVASSYFHHYTHATPTYATSSNNIATANGSYAVSSENYRSVAPPPAEELEEFVDIFQVQHLLLDHSVANGNQPPPHSIVPTNSSVSSTATLSSANTADSQTPATTSSSSVISITKPQPRPRLNLQKACEFSAQHQADSPSARRMLLDYPSPYLYGNHYHTSPSEDLVALWFGNNGSGMCIFLVKNYISILGIVFNIKLFQGLF